MLMEKCGLKIYMFMYSIVTNLQIIQNIKTSKYFKMSLGYASTMPATNGVRKTYDKDSFANFYNTQYKTSIYGQGIIGDMHFYIDYYITEPKIAIYTELNEEFIFDFEPQFLKENGIDAYLGHLLKMLDSKIEERKNEKEKRKVEEKSKANAEKLFMNPGAVSYEDLKSYLELKNKQRYEETIKKS